MLLDNGADHVIVTNDEDLTTRVVPILERRFPLEQIVEAHRYMESNQ